MKYVKFIWIFAIALPLGLTAQQEDLPSEQIEVVRSFEARLLDSEKLPINPGPARLDTARELSYTYQLNPRPYAISYSDPEIRPIAMRKETLPDFYNGFLRMGYGVLNSPLMEVGYHFNEHNNLSLGVSGRHLSANDKSVDDKRFRETHGAVYGQYVVSPDLTIAADASLDVEDYYYYPVNIQEFQIDENILKRYTNFKAEATLFNSGRNRHDIDYFASFKLDRLTDNRASRENNVLLHFGGTRWMGGDHPLKLEIGTDFTNLRDTLTRNLNNFFLKSSFTYNADRFSAKGGFNLSSSDDEFYFFPVVELNYRISGQSLIAFAGADGDLYKNNYSNLSSYNPFINHRLDTLGNTTRQKIFAGIRGLYKRYSYSLEFSYQKIERMAFYLPNEVRWYLFDPIFDETQIYSLQASIGADVFEGFRLQSEFTYNHFNNESLSDPWHVPSLIWSLTGIYRDVGDRLHLRSSLFIETGVKTLDRATGETEGMKGLFDLNIGADYYIAENFAVFLNVQNLFNNKRQRWVNYRGYGINGHAGLFIRL